MKQTIEYQMSDIALKASALPPFLGETQSEIVKALQRGESGFPTYLFSESVILLDNPYSYPLYVELSLTAGVDWTVKKWSKGWNDDLFDQILASEQRWERGKVDHQVFWWKGENEFLSPKKTSLPGRGTVYMLPPKDPNIPIGRSSLLILLSSNFEFETAYANNILYNSLNPNLVSDVLNIRGNLVVRSAPEGVSPRYYENLSNWQDAAISIDQPFITAAE